MLRNLVVVLDFSENVKSTDYMPTRLDFLKRYLQSFVREFFDDNPLSRMGLVIMRARRAFVASDLTCFPISVNSSLHLVLSLS